MGTGYYWVNLTKKECIMPQLNGIWLGYKRGEWGSDPEFNEALVEYIHGKWAGDQIALFSEYQIEDLRKVGVLFSDIIIDGIPLRKNEKEGGTRQ